MKALAASAFVLIMTTNSSFAGGERFTYMKNKVNLQAMSCAAGYTWNEDADECVQDANA